VRQFGAFATKENANHYSEIRVLCDDGYLVLEGEHVAWHLWFNNAIPKEQILRNYRSNDMWFEVL